MGYGLNKVEAKLSNTSHAWIGMIILITNLVTFAKAKASVSEETLIR